MSDTESTHVSYVVGFALSPEWDRVLLIKKTRPEWQHGKLNGVGGKIEPDESPVEAMVREFREETNLMSLVTEWRLFCTLSGVGRYGELFRVWFFVNDTIHILDTAVSSNDEALYLIDPNKLRQYSIINNLTWLLPMAMADSPVLAEVKEQL